MVVVLQSSCGAFNRRELAHRGANRAAAGTFWCDFFFACGAHEHSLTHALTLASWHGCEWGSKLHDPLSMREIIGYPMRAIFCSRS